jgi:hypothetical protein
MGEKLELLRAVRRDASSAGVHAGGGNTRGRVVQLACAFMEMNGSREVLRDAVATLGSCRDDGAREHDSPVAVLGARREIFRIVNANAWRTGLDGSAARSSEGRGWARPLRARDVHVRR